MNIRSWSLQLPIVLNVKMNKKIRVIFGALFIIYDTSYNLVFFYLSKFWNTINGQINFTVAVWNLYLRRVKKNLWVTIGE